MAGEYTAATMIKGVHRVRRALRAQTLLDARPALPIRRAPRPRSSRRAHGHRTRADAHVDAQVHARPPSFCTGCPERPIFAAMKLVERELGQHHVSCDIGCHLFSILPPFNIGATTMGYGLGWAGAAALNTKTTNAARSASWATAGSGTTA